jgi:hypothetical protein
MRPVPRLTHAATLRRGPRSGELGLLRPQRRLAAGRPRVGPPGRHADLLRHRRRRRRDGSRLPGGRAAHQPAWTATSRASAPPPTGCSPPSPARPGRGVPPPPDAGRGPGASCEPGHRAHRPAHAFAATPVAKAVPRSNSTSSVAERRGTVVPNLAPHRDGARQLGRVDESRLRQVPCFEADGADEHLPAGRDEPLK